MQHPTAGIIPTAARFTWSDVNNSGHQCAVWNAGSVAGGPISGQLLVRANGQTIGKKVGVQIYESGATTPNRASNITTTLTGGAQLITVSGTCEGDGHNLTLLVYLVAGSAAGDVLDVTGAQIEAKAYSTSLAAGSMGVGYSWATTPHASASTRSGARLVTLPTGRIFPDKGTIAARFLVPSWAGNANTGYLVFAGQYGGPNSFVAITRATGSDRMQYVMRDNNSGKLTLSPATTFVRDQTNTVIFRWNGTNVAAFLNGVKTASAASGPLASLAPELSIGLHTSQDFNAYVRDLMIFDRDLSDLEAARLFADPDWSFDLMATSASRFSIGVGISL